ncbi:ATPase [Candidatus Peregrinibacteria bacterium]|nr:MAG: ATPase [Candidatus Peregrinibacteria bacterium]
MRYLLKYIQRDLCDKMVILSGPRQAGKTTLSQALLKKEDVYLNWDIEDHQKIIKDKLWKKDINLVVFDELHKYLKWKNFLKGIIDEFQNTPALLVTGSARLDIFKHEGDALTGRYYHYRLHPIDLAESKNFLPEMNDTDRLDYLLETGGFPEAFLNPQNATRLRTSRFDLVLYEDLRDLNKTSSVRGLKLLISLLRERIGQQVNESNLAQDIGVSPTTVRNWIILLENLYVIFLVPPYSKGLARSIRKEKKVYFYDCAAGLTHGARLENVAGSSLLKYCHFMRDVYGKELELYYYRDREGREVDFVITENIKVKWCLEIKSSDGALSKSLQYLDKKINPENSYQLVQNISIEKEKNNIQILSFARWFDNIYNTTQ